MGRGAHSTGDERGQRDAELAVRDDLGPDWPITEEELRAIEAFLFRNLAALLGDEYRTDEPCENSGGASSCNSCHNVPPKAAPRGARRSAR